MPNRPIVNQARRRRLPAQDPATGRPLNMQRPADRERALDLLEQQPVPFSAYVKSATGPGLIGGLIGALTGKGGGQRAAIGAGIGAGVGVGGLLVTRWALLRFGRWLSDRAAARGH